MASLQVLSAPQNQPALSPKVVTNPVQPSFNPRVAAPVQPTLAPRVVTQPPQPQFNPRVQSQPTNQPQINVDSSPRFVPLGDLVKSKYPGVYDDMDSGQLGQIVATKYPGVYDQFIEQATEPVQPRGLTSDMPQFSGSPLTRALKQTAYQVKENTLGALKSIPAAVVGLGELGDKVLGKLTGIQSNNSSVQGSSFFNPTSDAQKAGFIGGQIGQALVGAKPGAAVVSKAGQVSNAANLQRLGKVGSVAQKGLNLATRSAVEAGLGYGTTKVQGGSDETAGTVAKIGAAIPAAGALAKPLLQKALPKLLSFTSPVPEEVLQRNISRPLEMKEALQVAKQGQGEAVLTKVQSAVTGLRSRLTKQYKEGLLWLADQFPSQRIGLNEKDLKTFTRLADEFAITPKVNNVRNMSVKESLQFYKQLNEAAPGLVGQISPKGALLREFRDTFRSKMVKTFGGPNGEVDQFLRQYSIKKSVHEAADSLVKAYKTDNPKAQATALKTLKNAYKESNGAYLDALKDLEDETGMKILDYVAALQQTKLAAPSSSALGNSVLGKADKLLKALTFPLTSPRLASFEARTAGRLTNGEGPVRTLIFGPK